MRLLWVDGRITRRHTVNPEKDAWVRRLILSDKAWGPLLPPRSVSAGRWQQKHAVHLLPCWPLFPTQLLPIAQPLATTSSPTNRTMEGPAQAVMTAQQIPNAADLPQQPNNPAPYPGGVKPKKYHWYASRYLCLITALILLAFALRHLYTTLERRYRRRTTPSRRPRSTSSVATALDAVTQRFLFLTTLPSWLYGPDTPADALCTTIYCSLMFYFALNHTTRG